MHTDPPTHHSALSAALSQSLEALAFVEILPLGEDAPPEVEMIDIVPRREVIWASIPIVKPSRGNLTVLMSPRLCQMLTEQIYGSLEQAVNEQLLFDSIAELANVITGRYLDRFFRGSEALELGIPSRGRAGDDTGVPVAGKMIEVLDYAVESHKLTVILSES